MERSQQFGCFRVLQHDLFLPADRNQRRPGTGGHEPPRPRLRVFPQSAAAAAVGMGGGPSGWPVVTEPNMAEAAALDRLILLPNSPACPAVRF